MMIISCNIIFFLICTIIVREELIKTLLVYQFFCTHIVFSNFSSTLSDLDQTFEMSIPRGFSLRIESVLPSVIQLNGFLSQFNTSYWQQRYWRMICCSQITYKNWFLVVKLFESRFIKLNERKLFCRIFKTFESCIYSIF